MSGPQPGTPFIHPEGCQCPVHGGRTDQTGFKGHKIGCMCKAHGSHHLRNHGKPLEELLVKGILVQGNRLKQRLIQAGMLKDECVECQIGPEWNGKPLTLELDHIDGDRSNNLRENLRVLCPNCHSQTSTFRWKNAKTKKPYKVSIVTVPV